MSALAIDLLNIEGIGAIPSAGTVDLENATGDLLDISGTTTITSLLLQSGHERTVRFTGILTLTNGANLVLPGAANITTAAGDFAVFRGYRDGVVRCVDYTKADGGPVSGTGIVAQTITNGVTTSAPSQDAVFDALALKQDLAWTVVSSAAATVSPTAADSGKYYRLSNASAVFNLPTTNLVVGVTEFWITFTGGNTNTIDAGTGKTVDHLPPENNTGAADQLVTTVVGFHLTHVKYVATNVWASNILNTL